MISSRPVRRSFLLAALLGGLSFPGAAQETPAPPASEPMTAESGLDTLVGPIALYPDPLVALILPASTVPSDVSAAAAYQVQYGDPTQIDRQPWDPSVRALAHYPAVIAWMASNAPWTRALGAAFLSSPSDVMASIQAMRARALAAGVLATTPEQLVLADNGTIEIVPTRAGAISVPLYDPSLVYSDDPYAAGDEPPLSFAPACPAGEWLSFGIDWGQKTLWNMGRGAWNASEGWRRPSFTGSHRPKGARPWNPPNTSGPAPFSHPGGEPLPRPVPMPATPVGPSAVKPPAPGEPPRGGTGSRGPADGPGAESPGRASPPPSASRSEPERAPGEPGNGRREPPSGAGSVVSGDPPRGGAGSHGPAEGHGAEASSRASSPPAASHSEPERVPEPERGAPSTPDNGHDRTPGK